MNRQAESEVTENELHGYLIGFHGGWHMINGEIKAGINTHLSGNSQTV